MQVETVEYKELGQVVRITADDFFISVGEDGMLEFWTAERGVILSVGSPLLVAVGDLTVKRETWPGEILKAASRGENWPELFCDAGGS